MAVILEGEGGFDFFPFYSVMQICNLTALQTCIEEEKKEEKSRAKSESP